MSLAYRQSHLYLNTCIPSVTFSPSSLLLRVVYCQKSLYITFDMYKKEQEEAVITVKDIRIQRLISFFSKLIQLFISLCHLFLPFLPLFPSSILNSFILPHLPAITSVSFPLLPLLLLPPPLYLSFTYTKLIYTSSHSCFLFLPFLSSTFLLQPIAPAVHP